jgi:hypothetical protein
MRRRLLAFMGSEVRRVIPVAMGLLKNNCYGAGEYNDRIIKLENY